MTVSNIVIVTTIQCDECGRHRDHNHTFDEPTIHRVTCVEDARDEVIQRGNWLRYAPTDKDFCSVRCARRHLGDDTDAQSWIVRDVERNPGR